MMNRIAPICFLLLVLLIGGCKEKRIYQYSGIYATSNSGLELPFHEKPNQKINIDPDPLIGFENFETVQKEYSAHNEEPILTIHLDKEGTEKFKEITSRFIGARLVLIFNDRVLSAPIVQTRIPNGRITVPTISEREIDQILDEIRINH